MYNAEIILTGPPYFQCQIEAPKTKEIIYVSQLGVVPSDSWQTKVSEECDKEYCLQEGPWGIEQVFVTELASVARFFTNPIFIFHYSGMIRF